MGDLILMLTITFALLIATFLVIWFWKPYTASNKA